MKLDPKGKKMAFVVVDVQKKFHDIQEDYVLSHDFRIYRINQISKLFREHGRPVIFVKYVGGDEYRLYKGDDGDDFFDGIEVEDSDIIVEKHHMNSFRDSGLDKVVKDAGCDSILIAGTVTQYCVLATYFGAFDYDIIPFMAQSATMSNSEEYNHAVETVTKTLSLLKA